MLFTRLWPTDPDAALAPASHRVPPIMTNDDIDALLREVTDRDEQQSDHTATSPATDGTLDPDRSGSHPSAGPRLDRSFASEYLDELIIAILFRCEEANGMDIIREFTHRFGVQFSPGTVYPHLHTLEEEGVLDCRECVQIKEYRIDDHEAAREYLDSIVAQLSFVETSLSATVSEAVRADETPPL